MDLSNPRILVYRRTHTDDPKEEGIFGIEDCMGSIRDWEFDAVIGIGGSKPWAGSEGIAYKVTWIGIGPERRLPPPKPIPYKGKYVLFKHFLLLDDKGPAVTGELRKYMFENGKIPRAAKNFPPEIYAELKKLLELAAHAPRSPGFDRIDLLDPLLTVRAGCSSASGKS